MSRPPPRSRASSNVAAVTASTCAASPASQACSARAAAMGLRRWSSWVERAISQASASRGGVLAAAPQVNEGRDLQARDAVGGAAAGRPGLGGVGGGGVPVA